MRARYVVRISPRDVGQRVSVRAWLAEAAEIDQGPRHTDVLGELVAWQDGWLSIRRRNGEVVRVDEALLVAGKVIPPAPPRRRADRG